MITAGAMLLPACVKHSTPGTMTLKHLTLTGDQEALVAEIAETIIPGTDIPGAKQMNLQSFILKMVDDCQGKEAQQKFQTGMKDFEALADKKYGKSFAECTQEEKKAFLTEVDANAKAEGESPTALSDFYSMTRRYTILGFTNSEYIMTNVLVYNMIPGRFEGCVKVNDANDIKTVIG